MSLKIEQDHARFRQIVRGRIKQNLQKYVPKGEMIGKKGKDFVSIPVPQHRHPALPLRRASPRAASARATASRATRSAPGDGQQGAGQAGQGDGRAHPRSRRLARRARRHPRRGARAAPHRAEGQGARSSRRRIKYTGIAPRGPRVAAPLQAHLQQALKRQIASGTYDPDEARRSSRSARTSAIARWKTGAAAGGERGHHLHDGRVGLDGRRAEGDRPHRVVLDRYLAAQASTRASRPATSSTTPSRARSTATRSSTRASAAAR